MDERPPRYHGGVHLYEFMVRSKAVLDLRPKLALLIAPLLVVSWVLAFRTSSAPAARARVNPDAGGTYVVQELDTLAASFWARVSGRDAGLPPHVNGHDEFASAWVRVARANLRDLPVGVIRQRFATPGFRHLPATRPGVNIIVAVPGSRHPGQAIVIGAHYDGEPASRGSAYDDTSGSALVLGLTRALGETWRSRGLPSRTVEFVLFDGEEQGLVGSGAFAFADRQHAIMPRPVLMMDEEQSGVAYPVRPFGLLADKPLPSFAMINGSVPRQLGRTVSPGPAVGRLLRLRLLAGRAAAFRQLHMLYPSLHYRGGAARAFTPGERHYLEIGAMKTCCSDNAPFEELGALTVTLSGDFSFYSHHASAWAYPFDQPLDTRHALACDTGGSPQPSSALTAALAIPLALSTQLVQDYAPPRPGTGIVVFSSLPVAGVATRFRIVGAGQADWRFGDGAHARGPVVRHVYRRAGRYRLTVLAHGRKAMRWVWVHSRPIAFSSPLGRISPPPIIPWHPPQLRGIAGCP